MATKKTIPLETRVDLVDLATCLDFFVQSGVVPTTKSQLVALCVTGFSSILVQNKKTKKPTLLEANIIMENMGLGIRSRGKVPRGLMESLVMEEANVERRPAMEEEKKPPEDDLNEEADEEADEIRREQEEEEEEELEGLEEED